MNNLFEEEIRGHHSMRDHLLTLLTDADLDYKLPGANPTLGALLIELGELQGRAHRVAIRSTRDLSRSGLHLLRQVQRVSARPRTRRGSELGGLGGVTRPV